MPNNQRIKVHSLFLSDLHIMCKYFQADKLLKFLRNIDTENLFLVGDIIDGYKMKKGIYWTDTYTFILRRIAGMIKDGTKVFYITGNHDEFLRKFSPNSFGHIYLLDEYVYKTIDGRQLLIIHGDMFDRLVEMKWLYYFGDYAYSLAMYINKIYNLIRKKLGLPYWSLSLMLKKNIKGAINFISDFEHYLAIYAKSKKCDGVVCGHIHVASIKNIHEIDYYNPGEWQDGCYAIVEHLDGRFELVSEHFGNFNG